MYNFPYLKDTNFLMTIDQQHIKEKVAKLVILDWKENPIKEITGNFINGNINLDGSSSMRRTANLSIVASQDTYNIKDVNNLISINKKVQMLIGVINNSEKYKQYPILWFPQGIFIIVGASISHDISGIKISVTLHDKMALLNGECGGVLPAAVTFHESQEEDEYGNIIVSHPTIVQIIQELVNHFGNEQLGKIIIKDLQPIVKQVLKWGGDTKTPLYTYQTKNGNNFKVETTIYKIYRSIYDEVVTELNGQKSEEIDNILTLKKRGQKRNQIQELDNLLILLQELKDAIISKNYAIEEEINNLNTIKQILEAQNFSLTEDVIIKLQQIYGRISFIKQNVQNNIKIAIKKQEKTINRFNNNKQLAYSLLRTGAAKQVYYRTIELKQHYNQLKSLLDSASSQKIEETAKKILSKALALPQKKGNENFYNYFLIPLNKKYTTKGLKIIGTIYDVNAKPVEKTRFLYRNNKNQMCLYNPIEDKAQLIGAIEASNYACFKEWITIREYLLNAPIYKQRRLQFYEKNIIFYSICSLSFGANNKYNTIAQVTQYLLNGMIAWCDEATEALQELINSQENIIIAARETKQSLLNSSLLKINNNKQNSESYFTGSFIDFVNLKLKELKDIINLLPKKKNGQAYRTEALKEYQILENQFQTLKININELNDFTELRISNESIPTRINQLYTVFQKIFQKVMDAIMSPQEYGELFYCEWTKDTSLQKARQLSIKTALQQIEKNLTRISQYKTKFTQNSLIQLQQWLGSTDFGENDFQLPKTIQQFNNKNNLISFPALPEGKSNLDTNFKQLIEKMSNSTFKKVSLNKNLLDQIIKQISICIDSNVKDININTPLETQITEYIKKIQELIKYQDNQIKNNIQSLQPKKNDPFLNHFLNKIANIQEFNYGEDVGYTITDFTYPGTLIGNPGQTVTSILDKIKDTLGNFEYFYDINGNFIFQQIKNYLNKSYSTYLLDNNTSPNYNYNTVNGKIAYNFGNGELIQSYNSNPQYQQIKNDFIVWGQRNTVDGKKYPIRYHLAIDQKPAVQSVYCFKCKNNDIIKSFNQFSDLPNEPPQQEQKNNVYYYVKKENQFYQWKQEKNSTFFGYKKSSDIKMVKCEPKPKDIKKMKSGVLYWEKISNSLRVLDLTGQKNYPAFRTKDYRMQLFLDGVISQELGLQSNDYYTELKNELPKIFDMYPSGYYPSIQKNPDNMDFYLDFLSGSDLTIKYGIANIGKRTQVISNNSINCIFEPQCPNIVYLDANPPVNKNQSKSEQEEEKNNNKKKEKELRENYKKWNQKNVLSPFSRLIEVKHYIFKNFVNGGTARSAYEEIRSALYQYITYNEQLSLTTLPIYYLQPNTLIQINDEETNITGNFLIKSISLSLGQNDTMNISCTQALERI